jgi:hypothetical protein
VCRERGSGEQKPVPGVQAVERAAHGNLSETAACADVVDVFVFFKDVRRGSRRVVDDDVFPLSLARERFRARARVLRVPATLREQRRELEHGRDARDGVARRLQVSRRPRQTVRLFVFFSFFFVVPVFSPARTPLRRGGSAEQHQQVAPLGDARLGGRLDARHVGRRADQEETHAPLGYFPGGRHLVARKRARLGMPARGRARAAGRGSVRTNASGSREDTRRAARRRGRDHEPPRAVGRERRGAREATPRLRRLEMLDLFSRKPERREQRKFARAS